MVKVKIVSRNVVKIPASDEEVTELARISYQYPGLPPRTVWIDKDKATKENVLKLIKADLARVGIHGAELELEL